MLKRIIPEDDTFRELVPVPLLSSTMASLYGGLAIWYFRAMRERNIHNGVLDSEAFGKQPIIDEGDSSDLEGDDRFFAAMKKMESIEDRHDLPSSTEAELQPECGL